MCSKPDNLNCHWCSPGCGMPAKLIWGSNELALAGIVAAGDAICRAVGDVMFAAVCCARPVALGAIAVPVAESDCCVADDTGLGAAAVAVGDACGEAITEFGAAAAVGSACGLLATGVVCDAGAKLICGSKAGLMVA